MSKEFKTMVEYDEVYANSINRYMCTDFCICPGIPTDKHYIDYSKVEKETYDKYDRTFTGFTGKINLDAKDTDKKPLFWAFDPSTG